MTSKKLSNDTSRCHGENANGICPKRETCLRYIDRFGGGEWTSATNRLCDEQGQDMGIEND